eukprot:TRINITY_DN1303_c0_g1_i1.p1 TRINITY_DN1303_c0_g1~~TRINITY_DN1303_c0_g1_i1.p1  ORF type:complete len:247 (-),score=122.60 TRINITY_DN1303_c0_g1_i1:234-974(-)
MSSKPAGGDRAPKKQKVQEEAAAAPAPSGELNESEKKLETLQESLDKLEQDAAEEIIAIQKKYNSKKKPIYEERAKAIAAIPGFWTKAITNHQLLNSVLTEKDTDVFKYLESLDVADFEDIKLGFRIELRFKSNPYFKNPVLFKEFRYTDDGEFESVTPSSIEWKEGQDLTIQNVDDDEQQESFFSFWFDPRNEDTEVAEMIKEIFASPSKYYHNLVPFVEEQSGSELDDDEEESEEGEEDQEDNE